MHEQLGGLEASTLLAEDVVVADPDIGELHVGVIGRHVERPHEFLDTEAGRVDRHDEAGDAVALAGLPEVRAKMKSWVAWWSPVFQYFSPLITHSSPSRTAVVSIHVASEPCSGSVSRNRCVPPGKHLRNPLLLLRLRAVLLHHQHSWEVADD